MVIHIGYLLFLQTLDAENRDELREDERPGIRQDTHADTDTDKTRQGQCQGQRQGRGKTKARQDKDKTKKDKAR